MNKVELIGHVGKDPDIKQTKSGKKMMQFSLATTESFSSSLGNVVKNTCWHRVVLWNEAIEKYQDIIKKGKYIYVLGRISNRSWVGEDGQNRNISEVVCDTVEPRTFSSSVGVV